MTCPRRGGNHVGAAKLDKIKNLHHVLHSVAVIGNLPFVVPRLAGKPAGSLPRKVFQSLIVLVSSDSPSKWHTLTPPWHDRR